MLLPHNKVSGGVQGSQIMIPSFFDRFYVMPPLTNGVHYIFCTHRPLKRFLFLLVLISFEHFTSARAAENRSQPSIDLKE